MPTPLIALLIATAITLALYWIFNPKGGPFWQWRRGRELTAKVLQEDALKHIHQCEIYGDKPTVKSLAGALNTSPDTVADILSKLEEHELLKFGGADFQLTTAGKDYALRIIRAHRLYERYLADETGFTEVDWHEKAERFEHRLTTEEADALAARLGNPTHDPHGDPIPTSSGHMVYADRVPLTSLEVNRQARIIHLEDEPETVYAQIVAEGLHVGQEVHLMESSPQRVRLWAGSDEHIIAPVVAANISVAPLEEVVRDEPIVGATLSSTNPGEANRVTQLSQRIRGAERRRLMDLGILPGTLIETEMSSASGNPVAYRIRGAVIALRKSQADLIYVTPDQH